MKTKLSIVFVLLTTFISINVCAQFDTQKLLYSLERNNPDDMNNLSFTVIPLSIDVYEPNISFGFELGVEYHFRNTFIVGARISRALTDRWSDNYPSTSNGSGSSVYKPQRYTNFNIYGQLLLWSKTTEVEQRVVLKSVGHTDYVTDIPANRLEVFSFRFGYNPYFFWADSDYGATYRLQGYKVNLDNKDLYQVDGGTMLKNNAVTVGFSRIRKSDLKVKLNKGYGKRDVAYKTEIYFDVIYAFSQEYQNMLVTKEYGFDDDGNLVGDGGGYSDLTYRTLNMEYNVDDNTARTAYGFRLGARYTALKKFGWSYGVETGFRPGPGDMIRNWFLTFNVGMSFATGI